MSQTPEPQSIVLGEHRLGRFDKRLPIGPVQWAFHDLLWIHEGSVQLRFPGLGQELALAAPAGVLILPRTAFSGGAIGAFATASICHFTAPAPPDPGFMVARPGEALHIQNLLRLSLELARRPTADSFERRQRLLVAILDCFGSPDQDSAQMISAQEDRLTMAWSQAVKSLHKMRTLSDIAALIGVHESALRTMHRKAHKTSAGNHLRELRLKRAEELLATSGYTIAEIAQLVGYGHAETLNAAFQKSRGRTPGQFRHWSNPFA
jgi:AraC-like DNA-binding protein